MAAQVLEGQLAAQANVGLEVLAGLDLADRATLQALLLQSTRPGTVLDRAPGEIVLLA